MAHDHKHHHHDRKEISGAKLFITILLNLLITIVEIIGGLLSKSLSLLADSLHNLSDTLAISISYVAYKISKKKASPKRTFGYKRAEIIAALINSSILIIISFFLFKEAIKRIRDPQEINSILMMVVAVIGLAANLISVLLLKKDSHENINIKSAYLHLLSDTLSSVAIIIGGVVIYFFKIYWIDPILTIIIGLYVLRGSYVILMETVNIFMQTAPPEIDIEDVQKKVESIKGIRSLHHIHIWKLNDQEIYFEGHIEINDDIELTDIDKIRNNAENLLTKNYGISHTTLQMECYGCEDKDLIHKK